MALYSLTLTASQIDQMLNALLVHESTLTSGMNRLGLLDRAAVLTAAKEVKDLRHVIEAQSGRTTL